MTDSGIIGADTGQLADLEREFETQAAAIREIKNLVTSKLSGTNWTGTHAQRFRDHWTGEGQSQLENVANILTEQFKAAVVASHQALNDWSDGVIH